MKRVIALGDLHGGSYFGLTPPSWGFNPKTSDPLEQKLLAMSVAYWNWFANEITQIQKEHKIDVAFWNGDLLDGKADRNGGLELHTADRFKQAQIAADVIKFVHARKNYLLFGTQYHTGSTEDFEAAIDQFVAITAMGNVMDISVDDVVFNLRHHNGRSAIPHGRWTPLAREGVWNVLKAERGQGIRADVLLRSHVHYHVYGGDANMLTMSLPCLQAPGSRYGQRICSGTTDFGFVIFDVEGRNYTWKAHLFSKPFAEEDVIQA